MLARHNGSRPLTKKIYTNPNYKLLSSYYCKAKAVEYVKPGRKEYNRQVTLFSFMQLFSFS